GHSGRPDLPACTRQVVDHDRLAPVLLHSLGNQTRHGVGASASGKRNDHPDAFAGIALGRFLRTGRTCAQCRHHTNDPGHAAEGVVPGLSRLSCEHLPLLYFSGCGPGPACIVPRPPAALASGGPDVFRVGRKLESDQNQSLTCSSFSRFQARRNSACISSSVALLLKRASSSALASSSSLDSEL